MASPSGSRGRGKVHLKPGQRQRRIWAERRKLVVRLKNITVASVEKTTQSMSYLEKPKGEIYDCCLALYVTFLAWAVSTSISLKGL